MPVAVAVGVAVLVAVAEPVAVLVLVAVAVFVLVALAVAVEVAVAVLLAVALAEPVFVPVVLIVADDVLVEVAVALAVLVEVGVAVLVDVAVADLVLVDVAVEVAVELEEATAAPIWPSRTCQRYVVAVSDTEIKDRRSPALANVALVSNAVFRPFAAVTTMSPPSVSIRSTKRMPGFVGFARMRVSVAVEVISQIWRSLFGRMVFPSPGSTITFGPRYRSW